MSRLCISNRVLLLGKLDLCRIVYYFIDIIDFVLTFEEKPGQVSSVWSLPLSLEYYDVS